MPVKPTAWDSIRKLEGSLIVSCQAAEGEPLCHPSHMVAMSLSAINGGAGGLRLEGAESIRAVRARTDLPVVGLTKSDLVPEDERLDRVYITGTFAEARLVAEAGADIVAADATGRERPDGLTLAQFIDAVHSQLGKPVWADVSTLGEGLAAAASGADVVSTTLYGYTRPTRLGPEAGPDFALLEALAARLDLPVVLEGRVWLPDEVRRAFDAGAYAVVVGSAITRPALITRRFVDAIPLRNRA